MIIKQIYEQLRKDQLVNTLEDFSVNWLGKHKSTASYLLHKKKDLSITNKVNCLRYIIEQLIDLKKKKLFSEFNSKKIESLETLKEILFLDLFGNKNF